MNAHLSNDELTDILLGTPRVGTEAHIQSCPECRKETDDVARSLRSFKTWTHEQAAVREPALHVFTVTSLKETRSFVNWFSWSAVLSLIVIALALMIAPKPRTNPNMPQSIAQPDADDALLLQVQQELDNSVPRALAPAAVLTAERNRVIREAQFRTQ